MLLAVSDVVWQALIAAGVTVVLAWMQRNTNRAVAQNTSTIIHGNEEAAKKVDEVKTTLVEATASHEAKMDDLAVVNKAQSEQLEVIHKATNSLVKQLVDSAEDKGFKAGQQDQRNNPKQ